MDHDALILAEQSQLPIEIFHKIQKIYSTKFPRDIKPERRSEAQPLQLRKRSLDCIDDIWMKAKLIEIYGRCGHGKTQICLDLVAEILLGSSCVLEAMENVSGKKGKLCCWIDIACSGFHIHRLREMLAHKISHKFGNQQPNGIVDTFKLANSAIIEHMDLYNSFDLFDLLDIISNIENSNRAYELVVCDSLATVASPMLYKAKNQHILKKKFELIKLVGERLKSLATYHCVLLTNGAVYKRSLFEDESLSFSAEDTEQKENQSSNTLKLNRATSKEAIPIIPESFQPALGKIWHRVADGRMFVFRCVDNSRLIQITNGPEVRINIDEQGISRLQ